MKVVLVGPVSPFKGGIAHFNTCISKELERSIHSFRVVSWRRRFPKLFYPGKNEYNITEKYLFADRDKYVLDILNPITWLRASRKILEIEPDTVIFNFISPLLAPVLLVLLTRVRSSISKSRKIQLIAICHNATPHKSRLGDKFITKLCLSRFDTIMVHSQSELESIQAILRKSQQQIILGFHPVYSFFKDELVRRNIRQELGIKSNVILYFGIIRPYKGVEFLIRAMYEVIQEVNCVLLIVGEIWEGREEIFELIEKLGLSQHIVVVDRYVPDYDVGNYFIDSDLVVLPYLSATQSGISQIAVSFEKYIVSTDVGGLRDVMAGYSHMDLVKAYCPKSIARAVILSLIHI